MIQLPPPDDMNKMKPLVVKTRFWPRGQITKLRWLLYYLSRRSTTYKVSEWATPINTCHLKFLPTMDRLESLGNAISQVTLYDIKSMYNQVCTLIIITISFWRGHIGTYIPSSPLSSHFLPVFLTLSGEMHHLRPKTWFLMSARWKQKWGKQQMMNLGIVSCY